MKVHYPALIKSVFVAIINDLLIAKFTLLITDWHWRWHGLS